LPERWDDRADRRLADAAPEAAAGHDDRFHFGGSRTGAAPGSPRSCSGRRARSRW
jgi:hypothetical protein